MLRYTRNDGTVAYRRMSEVTDITGYSGYLSCIKSVVKYYDRQNEIKTDLARETPDEIMMYYLENKDK